MNLGALHRIGANKSGLFMIWEAAQTKLICNQRANKSNKPHKKGGERLQGSFAVKNVKVGAESM